jgi:hypothetical protein
MRALFVIGAIAFLQFGCHGNFELRGTLEDAAHRHASIDERITDWGPPSEKETLSDGRLAYTWKFPYAEEQILPEMTAFRVQHVCTVVITTSVDNAIQSYKMDDC